jgi:hypothetical protein
MTTMLNKGGNTKNVYNEWPPPYNPDFSSYGHVDSDYASTTQTGSFESPYHNNPDLVEHLVWDNKHLVSSRQEEMIEMQQRDEHFDYEHHETQDQSYSSPRTSLSWEAMRRLPRNLYTNIQSLEEKHQITHKTRKGAVTAYESAKKAAITASLKIREFDEKHQVVAKSKQTIGQGYLYIPKSLRRSM